ncbi:hypothetical protein KSP40_PGU000218 [Platanthera guangdongensis]|uniref:Uncharacterized protein n=1 Tax=Platanthera guangdongensis TaxID=2320717 RepID=A0ABR2MHU3_9ASPA
MALQDFIHHKFAGGEGDGRGFHYEGDLHSPTTFLSQIPFQLTVSEQKLYRLNILILIHRFAAFCFSLATVVFMASNSIIIIYSLFEICTAVWETLKSETLLPESGHLWFDFSHHQTYL